jgi:hypothetical protein
MRRATMIFVSFSQRLELRYFAGVLGESDVAVRL